MAEIALEGVRKVYPGEVEAVAHVSFGVDDGQLCVLVGPSGCGKSTLLRMIAGLETVTEGEIRIGERRVNELEPAERDIAMVFQNYALYPHMTVFANMAYGLKNRRVPKADIEARVQEAAATLHLSGLLDRKPRQLSGGQRQRVAMGRAIVRKPQAFLFDEPLSNLDAKLRAQTRVEIKRLQRRVATTSIYVTHDQLEAMTMADRLVVMNRGRIEQIGTPIEVYERPESVFVAGFIGSPPMNFLAPEAGTPEAEAFGGRGGDGARLGFRPEDARLVNGEAGEDLFTMPVTAVLAEPIGSDTYLHAKAGWQDDSSAPPVDEETLILRLPGKESVEPGTHLTAAVPRARLHRFGADGRRID